MFATIILTAAIAAFAPASVDDDMCFVDNDVAEEVDASRCFNSCQSCQNRCYNKPAGQERYDCLDTCYDANSTCCEANGKQGNYKVCGCH